MKKILCYKEFCKYRKGYICQSYNIKVFENRNCPFFEDYRKDKEYSSKYFIAVRTKNGKIGRFLKKGKKITINGIDFFTDSPPLEDKKSIYITHGRTGVSCRTVAFVKENWEVFLKAQSKVADVSSYPLAEYDKQEHKYFIKDGDKCYDSTRKM